MGEHAGIQDHLTAGFHEHNKQEALDLRNRVVEGFEQKSVGIGNAAVWNSVMKEYGVKKTPMHTENGKDIYGTNAQGIYAEVYYRIDGKKKVVTARNLVKLGPKAQRSFLEDNDL